MDKKQLIKKIIKGQLITSLIYTIVYFIISFIIWDFYNPFYWMIHLNEAPPELRFTLLIGLAFYYFILYSAIEQFEKDKKPVITNPDILAIQKVSEMAVTYLSGVEFLEWSKIEEKLLMKYKPNEQKTANRKD